MVARAINVCFVALAFCLASALADTADNEVAPSVTPSSLDDAVPLTVEERQLLLGVFSSDELDYISTDPQSLLIVRSWLKEQTRINAETTTEAGQSLEDAVAATAAQAQSRMDTFQAMRDYELNAEAVAARQDSRDAQAQDRMDKDEELAEPLAEDRMDKESDSEPEAEDRVDVLGFAEPEAEDRKDNFKHGGFGVAEPEAQAESRKDHLGGKHGVFGIAEPEAEAEDRKDHFGGKHGGFGIAEPEAEAEDRMDTFISSYNDRPEFSKNYKDDTITVYESVTILSMSVAALSLVFLSLVAFVFRRKIRIMLKPLFRPRHYAQF